MHIKFSASALVLGLALSGQTAAQELNVVTSIRPLQSLVANVTHGITTPQNIVPAYASPHNYALKPSDAQMMQNADIIFWVGHELESFLTKPISSLPKKAKVIELQEHDDHFNFLPTRKASAGSHMHGEQAHREDHEHEKHEHHDQEHEHGQEHEHEGHTHGDTDLHLWLDVENAKHFVELVAAELSIADVEHASQYQENAAVTLEKLDILDAEIRGQLANLDDHTFVTFHDAYQYFETQYGLKSAGTITLSPQTKPGAKRLSELQTHLKQDNVRCIFAEPQFDAKLVDLVADNSNLKKENLDPLGATLEDGPELYFSLLRNMGNSFADCLGE